MDEGRRAATRALAMVGTRFHLGGRNPRFGLDCIGLVLVSYGFPSPPSIPRRATFGASHHAPWDICLREIGLTPLAASEQTGEGDVLLLDCGRGRRHLAICAGTAFVHAHAALGRVVVSAALDDMTPLSRWRHIPFKDESFS